MDVLLAGTEWARIELMRCFYTGPATGPIQLSISEWRLDERTTNLWQTIIFVWASQHRRDRLGKNLVKTGHDRRQSCWQRTC